ncbi:hypothetical protein MNBD_BACTEROID02-476 [hydrothermal vent metagenome]|uniref:Uncharacterized protein n=1 Tax=hydrothermal vent metagenome TaxID=652676 RepID=A0A3B0QXF6_9ZZZZ
MQKDLNNIKNTGFKVPKDYFNTLEDTILSKIKAESILKNIDSPGFEMPNGYLDTLEDTVFNTLPKKENSKVISLFSKKNLIYISGVAAAIVIMFGFFWNNTNASEMELDYEMVESYLIDQNISSYEIASLLTEEELSNIDSEIMNEAFNDEGMEDYLLENVNFEDIIEQ